jgi:hypothetical protein
MEGWEGMGPCSAHRQASSCQRSCRFHWRQHPRFRSDPASRHDWKSPSSKFHTWISTLLLMHDCYCFMFRCPCVFSLSLWFSFPLYIAAVFLLYAEAPICGWKANWRERDKRGELYYRSLYLICQKHLSLWPWFFYLIFICFRLTPVNPGQPFWPMTRLLDWVDHRVGFQNYVKKA